MEWWETSNCGLVRSLHCRGTATARSDLVVLHRLPARSDQMTSIRMIQRGSAGTGILDDRARNRRRWRGRESPPDPARGKRTRKIGQPDAPCPAPTAARRRPIARHPATSRVRGRTGGCASTVGYRTIGVWSGVRPAQLWQWARSGLGMLTWLSRRLAPHLRRADSPPQRDVLVRQRGPIPRNEESRRLLVDGRDSTRFLAARNSE